MGQTQSQSMSLLTSKGTIEWYTPPEIAGRIRDFLGRIDLDPASCAAANVNIQAASFFSEQEDGLSRPWLQADGTPARVYLNPPYNGYSARWLAKAGDEYRAGHMVEGIALINSAPGYRWFEDLWREFPMILLRERLCFVPAESPAEGKGSGSGDGKAKKGQALVYFGLDWRRFVTTFADLGRASLPGAGLVLNAAPAEPAHDPTARALLRELYLRHDRIAAGWAKLLLGGSVLNQSAIELMNQGDRYSDEMEGFFQLLLTLIAPGEYDELAGLSKEGERFEPPAMRLSPPPAADPSTPEGREALNAWREEHYPELPRWF